MQWEEPDTTIETDSEHGVFKVLELPQVANNKEKLLRTMYFLYSQSVKDRQITQAVNILEKIATWSGVNPDEVQLDPVQLIINNLDETKI